MSVMKISGAISALGQHTIVKDGYIYAYIEITEPDGRRTVAEKVAVGNEVNSRLGIDAEGEFFLDRIFVVTGALRYQLWGAKLDGGIVGFDRRNFRFMAAVMHLICPNARRR